MIVRLLLFFWCYGESFSQLEACFPLQFSRLWIKCTLLSAWKGVDRSRAFGGKLKEAGRSTLKGDELLFPEKGLQDVWTFHTEWMAGLQKDSVYSRFPKHSSKISSSLSHNDPQDISGQWRMTCRINTRQCKQQSPSLREPGKTFTRRCSKLVTLTHTFMSGPRACYHRKST